MAAKAQDPDARPTEPAFAEDATLRAIEIPYESDSLAMLVLMPAEGKTLADVEAVLGARLFGRLAQLLEPTLGAPGPPRPPPISRHLREGLLGGRERGGPVSVDGFDHDVGRHHARDVGGQGGPERRQLDLSQALE